jgi:hypothetical protein
MKYHLVPKSPEEEETSPETETPIVPIDLDLDPETVEILLDDRISTGG